MYYHGSCSAAGLEIRLLPPNVTGILSEKGRNRNLDRVFFTRDLGLARIYAGRAARALGGSPVVYRVIPMGDVVEMSAAPGASVFHAPWAFVEPAGLDIS